MQKLKTLSLFKIAFLFVLNVYCKNAFLFVFSILYLLTFNYKNVLFLLILIMIKALFMFYSFDFIPLGYVEEVSSNKAIVNKVLYKVQVEENDNLESGDIVFFGGSEKIKEEKLLKRNIQFSNNENIKIIASSLYKLSLKRLNNFSNQSIFKKLLFNDYVDDNDLDYYLGYGFCFYYLLRLLYYKDKYLSIDVMLIYSLFFGFDLKYFLLIIDFIISFFNLDNVDKLGLKLIIICFINEYLFINYSILISLLFGFINMFDIENRYFYLILLQSFFFNQVQLLSVFFYKFIIKIRIFIFIFVLLCFVFEYEGISLDFVLNITSFILKLFSFSIRGKVSYLTLIILILLKMIFKICDLKLLFILLIILISPLNHPFKQVSFIDVGQGDAILLRGTLNSYNVLIDTGSTYNYHKLKNYLFKYGIYKIDYLIISHEDSDHSGNVYNLSNDFKIVNLIDTGVDVKIGDLNLKNINLGTFDNDNDNSLVYYTLIDDYSFLFTGDISKDVERLISVKTNINKINVLKVSHHGSKTSSDSNFISSILPDFAIISTNGMYNHPHFNTLETLNSYLSDIFITKNDKDIEFYFFGLFKLLKAYRKVLIC